MYEHATSSEGYFSRILKLPDVPQEVRTAVPEYAQDADFLVQVGFTNEGKLIALDLNLYNNAGNTLDLSHSVMDRALLHSDNCYRIPNVRAVGHLCKTNTASNTAFRGFGGPQVKPAYPLMGNSVSLDSCIRCFAERHSTLCSLTVLNRLYLASSVRRPLC